MTTYRYDGITAKAFMFDNDGRVMSRISLEYDLRVILLWMIMPLSSVRLAYHDTSTLVREVADTKARLVDRNYKLDVFFEVADVLANCSLTSQS